MKSLYLFIYILYIIQCLLFKYIESKRSLLSGNKDCGKDRIRLSWEDETESNRLLYKEALEESMRSRLFYEFVSIHQDAMNSLEAHDTCAFLVWHRRFLLAFENMLRSLNPKFKCLTIPYWDSMKNFQQMIDGKCDSIYSCAQIIQDLGGVDTDTNSTFTIAGRTVSGTCHNIFPTTYCSQDSNSNSNNCGCVIRNKLSSLKIPSGSGYTAIFNSIGLSDDYSLVTKKIQTGMHNEMHDRLGGLMSTYASPGDFIFYNWHATIDMLFYVFHRCHQSKPLDETTRKSSKLGFSIDPTQCKYKASATPVKSTDTIKMENNLNGKRLSVDDPGHTLNKYFKDIDQGNLYYQYVDSIALGDYSYTYKIPEAIDRMFLQSDIYCKNSGRKADSNNNLDNNIESDSGNGSGSGNSKDNYWKWYQQTVNELKKLYPNNATEIARQMEYLECMGYAEKFGVQNFSKAFLTNLNLNQNTTSKCSKLNNNNGTANLDIVKPTSFVASNVQVTPAAAKKITKKKTKTENASSSITISFQFIVAFTIYLVLFTTWFC